MRVQLRTRLTSILLPACALAASGLVSTLSAQTYAVCDTTGGQEPTVLTIEGGGSLGVYEAGMTHTLVEVFKRKRANPDTSTLRRFTRYCLSVATGASAGNINAFLAATSWCDATVNKVPESSIFWRTWITTGLTQLLPTHGDTSHKNEGGLFTRRHFRTYLQDSLRQRWKEASWIPGCLVNFGATVTRLVADTVPGAGSITARNQRMAFALRVKGIDTAGTPDMLAFVPDPRNFSYGRLAMLGPKRTTGENRLAWADAFRLIETSSGYPVAFQPLSIPFCTRLHGGDDVPVYQRSCAKHDSTIVLDGGLFDNGPIALAYSLYFETHPGYRPPTAIYLSPDRRRVWLDQYVDVIRAPRVARPKSKPHGLESLTQLASEAFPTARQYELAFAGRMLPAEIERRNGQKQLENLTLANIDLINTFEQQKAVHKFETDSLKATIARICLDSRAARIDTLALVPQNCAALASADTVVPERPVILQGTVPSIATGVRRDSLRAISTVDSTFRSTERWHPLAGDWIAGFGAFLGRPLREYDFYVGIYDAFVLLAENEQCNVYRVAHAAAPTRATNDDFRHCLADTLRHYLDHPPIELGRIAPFILRELYTDEFRRPLPRPDLALTPSEDSSLIVVSAIRHAMYEARMAEGKPGQVGRIDRLQFAPGHCTRVGMFDRMFCESGVVAFLDQLSTHPRAVAIMERWRQADDCHDSRWNRPDGCKAEPRFVAMIGDPEGKLFALTSDLLTRLETVTPDSAPSRALASGILFLHSAVTDRHRRGFDLGPPSIPTNANPYWRTALMFFPNSATLTPNTAGWGELTWEFRHHLGESPYALTLPVHLRVQSEIGKPAAESPDVSMIVPGLRLEHKDVYMATRLGFQMDAWFTNRGWLPSRYVGHTHGIFVSILGKVNITWTTVPAELTYFRDRAGMRPGGVPTILSVGSGDVRGLLYWGRRLLF